MQSSKIRLPLFQHLFKFRTLKFDLSPAGNYVTDMQMRLNYLISHEGYVEKRLRADNNVDLKSVV